MIYPLNEPISVRYKLKPRVLSFLNRIPYKDSFLLFLKRKFSNLNRLMDEEITINSRIIEHPLVFRDLRKGGEYWTSDAANLDYLLN